MKAIDRVRECIKEIKEGDPFTAASLRHLASAENVRQILNRLVKAGEIKRVARGVYAKPKHTPKVGKTLPSTTEIAKLIAKSTGETIGLHGAEAARQLQLTTQVPMKLVFYTTGYTREIKIRNQLVFLKHVNPSKIIAPGTIAGTVISALLFLGKEKVSLRTLQKIENQLTPEEFETILKEIQYMPAWMANVFYRFQQKRTHDQ